MMPSTQVSKDQMVNLLLIVPRYDANQLHVCHTLMILQVGLQAILVQTIGLQLIVVLLKVETIVLVLCFENSFNCE
jgi:hypothetical protein